MTRVRRRLAAGVLLLVGLGVVFVITAANADELVGRSARAGLQEGNARPAGGPRSPVKVVHEEDISKEDETTESMVWRNGAYHKVRVPVKRKLVTYEDGIRAEEVETDSAAAERQLPRRDPKFDDVIATPDQVNAARRAVGADSPPPPPPP